jgi:hypothetical protein
MSRKVSGTALPVIFNSNPKKNMSTSMVNLSNYIMNLNGA